MNSQTLNNGLKLSYLEQGDREETVVLLHGFCGSSAYWEPVIPELAERFRVLAPDLRGHGGSSVPPGPYTVEEMADDIALLLKQLGIRRVVLLGHSLGGYVTAAFAERYPQLLAGYGLVHSTSLPDDEAGKKKREQSIDKIRDEGMASFAEGLIPGLFAEAYREAEPAVVERMTDIARHTDPEGAIATLAAMKARPDRTAVLQKAEHPVLLVAGTLDTIAPPAKAFAAQGTRIESVTLQNAAHMGMFEQTASLAEALRTFAAKAFR